MRGFASCPDGYQLDIVEYTWTISGEDFHENTVLATGGTITYRP